MMRIRELDPNHPIFKEEGYDDNDGDYLSDNSVNTISQDILYRATRGQINCLNRAINQVEKDLMVVEEPLDENMEGAHASTASQEAPNGNPPPSRGNTTLTGPAARSSNSDSLDGGCRKLKNIRVLCYGCRQRTRIRHDQQMSWEWYYRESVY
jgi:hypothetical protein